MASLLLDPLRRSVTTGRRPLGLDGVPRVSRAAGHGFLVALDGAWSNDTTFVLHHDTVAGINRLTFMICVRGACALNHKVAVKGSILWQSLLVGHVARPRGS